MEALSVVRLKREKIHVTICVKAEDSYSFADVDNLTITLEGVKETAYSSLTATKDDSGQLVITVVFEPTDHTHDWDEENWSSDATHHWYACRNDGCPLIGKDYEEHIDEDGDGGHRVYGEYDGLCLVEIQRLRRQRYRHLSPHGREDGPRLCRRQPEKSKPGRQGDHHPRARRGLRGGFRHRH